MIKKIKIVFLILIITVLSSCETKNIDNNESLNGSNDIIQILEDGSDGNITSTGKKTNIKSDISTPKEITEKENIDRYNFEQLEIVKSTLDKLPKDSYLLRSYIDFNEKFEEKLEPIKNCYYLTTDNGKYPYIFGFKLESDKYIEKSGKEIYSYPEYDVPVDKLCFGMYDSGVNNECIDKNQSRFNNTIITPCDGTISGYVYNDSNSNGSFDNGEDGISGVGLIINMHEKAFTDKNGYYSFGNLEKDNYEISIFNLHSQYKPLKDFGYKKVINLKRGENINNINFGVNK